MTPSSHSPSLHPLFTSSLSLSLPGHKTGGPGEVSCAGVGVELRSMWRTGPRGWPGPGEVGSTWQGRVLLDANGYIYFHIFQNEHETGCLRAKNHILRELGGRRRTTVSSLLRLRAKKQLLAKTKEENPGQSTSHQTNTTWVHPCAGDFEQTLNGPRHKFAPSSGWLARLFLTGPLSRLRKLSKRGEAIVFTAKQIHRERVTIKSLIIGCKWQTLKTVPEGFGDTGKRVDAYSPAFRSLWP